jgi:threonine synthase
MYERTSIILDPHTAVGVCAARKFSNDKPDAPVIIAGTAHPSKFPEVIEKVIQRTIPLHPYLEKAMKGKKQNQKMAADYMMWRSYLMGW